MTEIMMHAAGCSEPAQAAAAQQRNVQYQFLIDVTAASLMAKKEIIFNQNRMCSCIIAV